MREQIQKLLHAIPFRPFVVDVAEDVGYSIPNPDHVLLGKRVLVIEDDKGYVDLVGYQHIRRITHKAVHPETAARGRFDICQSCQRLNLSQSAVC